MRGRELILTLALREDLGETSEAVLGLTAKSDPVLVELWDNPADSKYDRL